MPRLPLASRQDILDELAEIQRDREDTVGTVNRARALERIKTLDLWEHDLRAQLAEMDAEDAR